MFIADGQNVLRPGGIRVFEPSCTFLNEASYQGDYDWVAVDPDRILKHPPYTQTTLTVLMRYRLPINKYELRLARLAKKVGTVKGFLKLWRVYYDLEQRVLISRVPYFVSAFYRHLVFADGRLGSIFSFATEIDKKGLVRNSSYWTDGTAIAHRDLIDAYEEEVPDIWVEGDPDLIASLHLKDYSLIHSLYLVDNPKLYAPAPIIEATSDQYTVSFYDSRYVDLLFSRWVKPGALISRVNGIPYLVFNLERVYPLEKRRLVLAIAPIPIEEEQANIWKAMCGDLLE